MAKNKNRKQAGRHQRSARSGADQAKAAVTESGTDLQTETPGNPVHSSRTKQRRFGHN